MAVGLRQQLFLAVAAVALLVAGAMYVVSETTVRRMLSDKISGRAAVIARRVASDSENEILTREQIRLSLRLRELVRSETELSYAYLLDPKGAVIAHSFPGGFPAALAGTNPLPAGSVRVVRTSRGDVFDAAVPILGGSLGSAHVGIPLELVERDVNEILRMVVASTAGIIGLMAILVGIVGSRATRPILELAGLARKVARGDLDQRATVRSDDEVGELAKAFNGMIEARRIHERDRDRLVSELREALENVRTLSGFLPICASCKKIRNDDGYWQQVESYLSRHTGVAFSHGICPDCLKRERARIAREGESRTGS